MSHAYLEQQLLPELRGRVFTITGIEGTDTLERARKAIAGLPEGKTWAEAKKGLLAEISPFFNTEPTGEDGEGPSAAERRAEILLRTHGFQAFNSANWRVAQEDADTTHLQYLATEDTHVRATHLALNGIILPKDDPFWDTHTPPWEWGCRCRIRAINPDLLDEARAEDEGQAPGNKLVIEGPQLQKLRDGVLVRDGRGGQSGVFDVTPPTERRTEGTPYQFHPDDLRIPVQQLRDSTEPQDWATFEAFAKNNEISPGLSVWEWMHGQESHEGAKVAKKIPAPVSAPARALLDTSAQQMKAAGFKPEQVDALRQIPPALDHFLSSAKFAPPTEKKGARAWAHYDPSTKTVVVKTDPKEWSGRPAVVHHEFGHHIHFEAGHINYSTVHPEIAKAMQADLASFRKDYKGKSSDWSKVNGYQSAMKVYGLSGTLSPEDHSKVATFLDTLGGLSRGSLGQGHPMKYYKASMMGAMECYANTITALVSGDQIYQKRFPNLVAALTGLLKL